jgi:hypothetical protein
VNRYISHGLAVVIAAAATWGATQINNHPALQNFIDREAIAIRKLGFACGVERWSVKTLADSAASQISFTAKPTTIAALTAIPSTGEGARTAPTETTDWQLTGVHVIAFKQEADSDIHLELSDGQGHTMIAEMPLQSCVTPSSNPEVAAEQQQIGVARAAFEKALQTAGVQVTGSYQSIDMIASLQGVGFFDFLHGQRGVAPNGIELHPVTAFAAGGTPPPPPVTTAPVTTSPVTTAPVTTAPFTTTPAPTPPPTGKDDALDELPGCSTYPGRIYYHHVKQASCKASYFLTP